jgi:RNA polymerase sigma factor (sigma-70 family)
MLSIVGTDRQLLDQFVRFGDQKAFGGIVSRHGPAVLQVCRGVLHDPHEAEDAFQATFLVLVRKAPALKDPEAVGGWLRGVAYRTAVRARCRTARRRAFERAQAEMCRIDELPDQITPDQREAIRDELDRLPELYRRVVQLCYMEGLTHPEAARKLAWPLGTVKIRLVRGRRLLRERLDRRGVGLGAALLLWLLEPAKAKAVPQPLSDATVRAMKLAAAGRRAMLASDFARPVAFANATLGFGRGPNMHWLWTVLALAGLLLGLGGSTVLAVHGPPAPEVDPATLPANLTNVLDVDCG